MPGELASRDGTVADGSRELIGRTCLPLYADSARQELPEMQDGMCHGRPSDTNTNEVSADLVLVDGDAAVALLDLLERIATNSHADRPAKGGFEDERLR